MSRGLQRVDKSIEDQAIDLVLEGKKLQDIAKAMGLKNTNSLQRYLMKFPEFMDTFQKAKLADCLRLEDEFEHVLDYYDCDDSKIRIEVIRRMLAWRDPKRYGERQHIDMSVSVDISGALDRAMQRVIDVTPAQNVIPLIPKKAEE